MSELPDELMARLRRIVAGARVTEAELRTVAEQADGLARSLRAQLEASERRLGEIADDPDSSIAEAARELRRVERLRPDLVQVRNLLRTLERRAREHRTEWLLHQAADAAGPAEAAADLEGGSLSS
jgi:GAF domain-containing protein